MNSPLTEAQHQEIQDLLGAYALDAVDKETATMIDAHLEECVKCSIEVAQHHEVAGLLANSGGPSPAGLWEGIAERLDRSTPPSWEQLASRLGPDGTPEDVDGTPAHGPVHTDDVGAAADRERSKVVSIDERRSRSRLLTRAATVVAAAAAVVAVVLGVQVHHLHNQVSALQGQPQLSGVERSALQDPTTKKVELTATTAHPNGSTVTVVLTRSGTGFVEAGGLTSLPGGETYQLWGVIGDKTISLGLLGSAPGVVPFSVAGNADVSAFAITAEQSGGVVHSSHQPVVAGEVTV
jgi:hypothetical protein